MQANQTQAMARHAHMAVACGTGWAEMVAKADEGHDETHSVGHIIATEFSEDGTVAICSQADGVKSWEQLVKFPISADVDSWTGKNSQIQEADHLRQWADYVTADAATSAKQWSEVTKSHAEEWWSCHCTSDMVRVACLLYKPAGWTTWVQKSDAVQALVDCQALAVPFQMLRFAYENIGVVNSVFKQTFLSGAMAAPAGTTQGAIVPRAKPPAPVTPTKASRAADAAAQARATAGASSPTAGLGSPSSPIQGSGNGAPGGAAFSPAGPSDTLTEGVMSMMAFFKGEVEAKKAKKASTEGAGKYKAYYKKLVDRVIANVFVDPSLLSPLALQEAELKLSGMQAIKHQSAIFGGIKVRRYEAEEDLEYREAGNPSMGYVRGLEEMISILMGNDSPKALVQDRMAWKKAVFSLKNVSMERQVAYCTQFMLRYQGKENETGWLLKFKEDTPLLMSYLYPSGGAVDPLERRSEYGDQAGDTKRRKRPDRTPADTTDAKRSQRDRGRGRADKRQKPDGGGKGGGKGAAGKGSRILPGGPCKSRLDPKATCTYGTTCKFSHTCASCGGQHAASNCSTWDQTKANMVAKQFNLPTVP